MSRSLALARALCLPDSLALSARWYRAPEVLLTCCKYTKVRQSFKLPPFLKLTNTDPFAAFCTPRCPSTVAFDLTSLVSKSVQNRGFQAGLEPPFPEFGAELSRFGKTDLSRFDKTDLSRFDEGCIWVKSWFRSAHALLFFFITLKPRVECYTKSMSLKYEPATEPLHISTHAHVLSSNLIPGP